MENKLIKNTIHQFQDVQNQEKWIDVNFQKKIEELSENQAFQRPLPDLHSVAELISHLLEWRKEIIMKLSGRDAKLTLESPENWRTNNELKLIGWEKLKSNFYNSHVELLQLIENQPDGYLENKSIDGYKFKYLIQGLIHHDLYHLGQIGITIKYINLK